MNFADNSTVLHATTSVNNAFEWTSEMQESFEYLKQKLKTSPVLAFPHFGSRFVVDIVASSAAPGLFLS